MKELIFDFVNQYAVWGILIAVCLVIFALWRMQRQLKRLNQSLGAMTGKIQEYFTAIMEEEQQEPQPVSTRETGRGQRFPVREEGEIQLSGRKEPSPEDEAVIHAVLQEYFS